MNAKPVLINSGWTVKTATGEIFYCNSRDEARALARQINRDAKRAAKCPPSKPGNHLALITRFGAPVEVKVMAIADGYAMVRRKGCTPFVVQERELTPIEAAHQGGAD